VTAWALETSLAVAALTLLVLALRRPVARLFGARWAYALWLLPLLRIAMPPLAWFGADLPLAPILVQVAAIGETAAPLPPQGGPGQWGSILLALWAGGAVCFLLWQAAVYRRFVREIAASARPAYPPRYAGIPLVESQAVPGPLATGLFTPTIVLPYDFLSRYTPAEQRLALEHEAVHHRRGDLWWNSLALLLLGLQWPSPLAWIAFRAFRADQELSCDEAVARRLSGPERHLYASALVKSASRPGLIAACPLNQAATLKRRLKMMKQHRATRVRTAGGLAALSGLLAGGLTLSAPSFAQSDQAAGKEQRRVIIREFGGEDRLKLGEREVEIGERELAARLKDCPEAQRLTSDVASGEGKEKQRTRIVLCTKDGKAPTPEMREKLVAALEKARTEIGSESRLTEQGRQQALEALRREIERVRTEGK
jgi:bla regulator protein blaR1